MKTSKRLYKGASLLTLPDNDYTVIDIETTGLDPSVDEIIELAAIRVRNGEISDSFSSLVKPSSPVSSFIASFTGIDNDMLADASSVNKVLPQYLNFIGDDIVVGHNVHFDINFIYDNAMKCMGIPFVNDLLDMLRISRQKIHDVSDHSLSAMLSYFNIHPETAHRALKDCESTMILYQRLCEIDKKHFSSVEEILSGLTFEKRESAQHYFSGKKVCVKRLHDGIDVDTAISVLKELGATPTDTFFSDCNILCLSNPIYKKYTRYGPYDKSEIVEKAKHLESTNGLTVISENDLLKKLGIPVHSKKGKTKDILSLIEKQDGFEDPENPLYGKTCVFTGTLSEMPRKDAMQIVLNIGGKCSNSVTKKTNFLILGTQDYSRINGTKSSKQVRAEQLMLAGSDLMILSENVFYDMLENYDGEI